MIHTNEPANVFYVLVSAARADKSDIVNMSRQLGLKAELERDPEYYGVLECTGLTGCYREEGQEVATEERTYRVRCENRAQAINVARLACNVFEQDCVMVYKSQTHTAGLMFCKGLDGYKTTRLNGSFQQVDAPKGECFTKDADRWVLIGLRVPDYRSSSRVA